MFKRKKLKHPQFQYFSHIYIYSYLCVCIYIYYTHTIYMIYMKEKTYRKKTYKQLTLIYIEFLYDVG